MARWAREHGRVVVTENVVDHAPPDVEAHAGLLFVNVRRWSWTPNGQPRSLTALRDWLEAPGSTGTRRSQLSSIGCEVGVGLDDRCACVGAVLRVQPSARSRCAITDDPRHPRTSHAAGDTVSAVPHYERDEQGDGRLREGRGRWR